MTGSSYAGVLGTAGHIDHGKSTLIKALTGTDPDRLKEEKARGITIELGFAELDLPDGTRLGVVDVPGHEKFIRHMVAGATGVDIALLVVAADDGVMVQTREHLAILQLLGVRQVVVALTKIDLAGPELTELAALDVATLLHESPYADAEIVPVSAVTGAGLDELRAAIARATQRLRRQAVSDRVRLPIDRVFTIAGAGTVVTGTLWEGRIASGDKLELAPGATPVRIRQIQEHGQAVEQAEAGQRVALNLAGVAKDEVSRGMIIATPGLLRPVSRFNAHFNYSGNPAQQRALAPDLSVHLHYATSEVLARLIILDSCELKPGQAAFVQLRLAEPLPLCAGDHFIIRAGDPLYSMGGGVVLDTAPRLRTQLNREERALLQALQDHDVTRAVLLVATRAQTPVASAQLAADLGFTRAEVAAVLNQADLERIKGGAQTAYLSTEHLEALLTAIEQALLAWHEAHPQETSLTTSALRDLLPARLQVDSELFEVLLQRLSDQGIAQTSAGKVAHTRAAVSARAQLAQLKQDILAHVSAQGLMPDATPELQTALSADRKLLGQALGALTSEGALVRLAGDLHFSPAALAAARATLTHALQVAPEGLSAAALRDALGVSRKYAIPILEYFDAQGLTVRTGDTRALK